MIGADVGRRAPVLVLGLGNVLLRDDGAGRVLLERVAARRAHDPRLECVDGGTQGLALLPVIARRAAMLVLDAVALGTTPGTVHVVQDARAVAGPRGGGAHEHNAADLLAAADLIGDAPARVAVVGIEPGTLRTGLGLSDPVARSIDRATARALDVLEALLAARPRDRGAIRCTS